MKIIRSVAFLGSGSGEQGDPMYEMMQKTGAECARRKLVFSTGGYGGSGMEAPARGAREIRPTGRIIGYHLSIPGVEPNSFVTSVYTLGPAAAIEDRFGSRLGLLLSVDAFIIGADGGVGTLVELAAIANLNLKFWTKFGDKETKRVAILNYMNEPSTLLECLGLLTLKDAKLREVVNRDFRVAFDPVTAVDWVTGVTPV